MMPLLSNATLNFTGLLPPGVALSAVGGGPIVMSDALKIAVLTAEVERLKIVIVLIFGLIMSLNYIKANKREVVEKSRCQGSGGVSSAGLCMPYAPRP